MTLKAILHININESPDANCEEARPIAESLGKKDLTMWTDLFQDQEVIYPLTLFIWKSPGSHFNSHCHYTRVIHLMRNPDLALTHNYLAR